MIDNALSLTVKHHPARSTRVIIAVDQESLGSILFICYSLQQLFISRNIYIRAINDVMIKNREELY